MLQAFFGKCFVPISGEYWIHRVYRVLGFLSSRRPNWLLPPPHPQASPPPLLVLRGRGTLARGSQGQTLWYLGIVQSLRLNLWTVKTIFNDVFVFPYEGKDLEFLGKKDGKNVILQFLFLSKNLHLRKNVKGLLRIRNLSKPFIPYKFNQNSVLKSADRRRRKKRSDLSRQSFYCVKNIDCIDGHN